MDRAQRAAVALVVVFAVIFLALGLYYGLGHRQGTPGAASLLSAAKSDAHSALDGFYATNAVAVGARQQRNVVAPTTATPLPEEPMAIRGFGHRQTQPDSEWLETTSFSPSQRPGREWFGRIRASRT